MIEMEVYRALFEHSPDGIVVVGPDGIIQDLNPAACTIFGYDFEELVGRPVEILVPESDRDRHVKHRDVFVREKRGSRPMGAGLELAGRRKDGTTIPVEISLSHLESGRSLATVRDVTLRRRLRNFGVGALRAAEDERTLIARDLHDDTAQQLAALLIHLRLLERAEDADGRSRQIETLRSGIEYAAEGIRRIARGLRPPELEDAGLQAALLSHTRRLEESRELVVDLDVDQVDGLLTPDTLLIVYRIVQEALTNVARHANVGRAEVRVFEEGGEVIAEVRDEGRGFSTTYDSATGDGLGVLGMHERAVMAGGRLDVQSAPGEGTLVRLRIPTEFDPERPRV